VTSAINAALRAIDDVWNEVKTGPFIARELGERIDRLPDAGYQNAQRLAEYGRELLERFDTLDFAALPADLAITAAVARDRAALWVRTAQWYWVVFDPAGAGFFSLFAPTAYAGGFALNFIGEIFRAYEFGSGGDCDRYLGLIEDYGRLVRQFRERTAGQAERGIYMPKAQLAQSIPLLHGLRKLAVSAFRVAPERLVPVQREGFASEIERRVAERVLPAFDEFIADLESPQYAARSSELVGMSQYPGGAEIYAELVRIDTTLDLTPQAVHENGLARMHRVHAQMHALFESIGFTGTPKEYLNAIEADPDWHADGAEALSAFFRRYIDRIAPHLPEYFGHVPQSGHDVAPLPEALCGAMTFGYYSPPNPAQDKGLYIFNAANLSKNALANIAALNYHELVPGHHFQIALQRENRGLHPLRKYSFFTAFVEGWAEYAASLAGEMKMYSAPQERFGRLMMEAFLTSRLIVDTGMNALGWTLEQARAYLREHSFMPENEIASETLRYACDIPAQALAYKVGDDFISGLREDLRAELGDRFDIRAFHDAVLAPGALPLPLMGDEVRRRLR
jgi:uncharacterized protein (DUF885 family)